MVGEIIARRPWGSSTFNGTRLDVLASDETEAEAAAKGLGIIADVTRTSEGQFAVLVLTEGSRA